MQRNAIYNHILEYARKFPLENAPVVMDLGCCMGTDIRKLVQDGYPISTSKSNVYGCDLLPEFVEEGYTLYRDGPNSNSPTPIKFFADDIFQLSLRSETLEEKAGSSGLKGLRGKIDILYAGALFHLFDEEKQLDLARRLVALLNINDNSANSETIIFGRHRGSPTASKGYQQMEFGKTFCHSPASWKEMWETVLVDEFGKQILERLKIEAVVEDLSPDWETKFNQGWLFWSITIR
ncbi:hypothetical protein GYMLUDRAFT_50535 [Collybiopsis luxurians FD-317 M1]|uniref:Methyltransferase domain-containing protein n=1 Tax=Collybiopsis luxurians FD-317 M1 TaxID=944289 RepID=A0A0D0BPD7_9AGAR|nr:hypothetical protein GYMLUDRAFT_50535 [Collybiopsis luxurians FD-317 M1]